MLEKFLDYIAIEKRYSQHTIISYKKDLQDFSQFIAIHYPENTLLEVNKKQIRAFIINLNKKEISKRSINRKLSSLRSFYLYLLKIGYIEDSPMSTITSLKFQAEKQEPFSIDEMAMLENEVEKKDKIPLLEKLIIETLYQTGMRKAELCGLLFEHVDFSKSEIKLIGKSNKQRVVPLSEKLLKDFNTYLQQRDPLKDFESYFFVNSKGKKLGERFVYSVVNKYLSVVTTKSKRSPHILRHSFATHVLNKGAEISKVKKILGHSSLASTQVYTQANIEELKKVFNKAHPRGDKKDDL